MTNVIKKADDLKHGRRAAKMLARSRFKTKVHRGYAGDKEVVVVEVKGISPQYARDVDDLMDSILDQTRT